MTHMRNMSLRTEDRSPHQSAVQENSRNCGSTHRFAFTDKKALPKAVTDWKGRGLPACPRHFVHTEVGCPPPAQRSSQCLSRAWWSCSFSLQHWLPKCNLFCNLFLISAEPENDCSRKFRNRGQLLSDLGQPCVHPPAQSCAGAIFPTHNAGSSSDTIP